MVELRITLCFAVLYSCWKWRTLVRHHAGCGHGNSLPKPATATRGGARAGSGGWQLPSSPYASVSSYLRSSAVSPAPSPTPSPLHIALEQLLRTTSHRYYIIIMMVHQIWGWYSLMWHNYCEDGTGTNLVQHLTNWNLFKLSHSEK